MFKREVAVKLKFEEKNIDVSLDYIYKTKLKCGKYIFLFVFTQNWFQNKCAKQKKIAAQLSPCVPLFPSSSSILTSSAGKENVSLPMTYATTKQFSQRPCFPSRCSPNLTSYCRYNQSNALEFTSPNPCVNGYLVYPPTNYDTTMNHIM